MFETLTNEKVVYKFTNKEWKEFKINYVWTITDKKVIDEVIKSIKDLAEKDPFSVRQGLLDRKLINTNKGLVMDAFAELDEKFGFVKETVESDDDDEDNPL